MAIGEEDMDGEWREKWRGMVVYHGNTKKVWGGGSAWFDGDVKREKRGAKQRRYVLQRNLYVDKY